MEEGNGAAEAFAKVLAFELDIPQTPELKDASDRVLIRLWMEGFKLVPVEGDE